jgi:hypothetical protein
MLAEKLGGSVSGSVSGPAATATGVGACCRHAFDKHCDSLAIALLIVSPPPHAALGRGFAVRGFARNDAKIVNNDPSKRE